MNFFTKKVKTQESTGKITPSISIDIHELPSEALEITYRSLMEKYETNPSGTIQQKLVLLSKIMTDRAYDHSNGEVKDYFIKKGLTTEEKWKSLNKEQKDKLGEMKQHMEELNTAIKNLSEPEPETIKIEISTPDGTFTTTASTQRQEKQQEMPQEKPKKKKKFGGFFKKKIKVIEKSEQNTQESMMDVLKDKTKLKAKPITPEQKERAKKMEIATENKLKKMFQKKKGDDKQKLHLPDVFCPDCSHPLKEHQTKGVSTGCKCGCLNSIEHIAERHGVQLFKPKEVLEKIEQEYQEELVEDLEVEPEVKEIIVNQAKKLESMVKNEESQTPILESIPQINPETEPRQSTRATYSVCANCDHIPKLHFDNQGFCTVIGCTCDNFRKYPE